MALLSAIVTFAATAFSSSMVLTLFVSRKTRAADLNNIKRWRVAAVQTALFASVFLLFQWVIRPIVMALFSSWSWSTPGPVAVTRPGEVLLLIPIFLLVGLGFGLLMIAMCSIFAAQYQGGGQEHLDRVWHDRGWKRWLGRDLPDSPSDPLFPK